jgi:hypothetical protein
LRGKQTAPKTRFHGKVQFAVKREKTHRNGKDIGRPGRTSLEIWTYSTLPYFMKRLNSALLANGLAARPLQCIL